MTPILIIKLFYKIYSLCKNNAISKDLNKLQAFHFRSTVHTNTTPTVSYDNGYYFDLKNVDQIGTSVSF